MIKIKSILPVFLVMCSISLYAQNIDIKGTVINTEQEPVIGASIKAEGTSKGTVTDLDGNFTLQVPKGSTLDISSLGYNTYRTTVKSSKINIITRWRN